MAEEVECPSCGRGNERGMAEAYRVCVHCGGDLGMVVSGSPMDELQRSIDGGPAEGRPPSQPPPVQQQAPGQPSYTQPPPSYGTTPPPYGGQPYGGQPYGGQPYPPPGYTPGPAYGYPPPMMYAPTYHPGLYDKPEQEPYIDIGNLFKLLFRPKEAFEDLYDHTTGTQGAILAIIFIVIGAIVELVSNLAIWGSFDLPDDATVPGVVGASGALSIVGIFTSIVAFFMTAWMFHAFIKEKARKPDLSKTMGMMGYAMFPAFLIGIIIAIAAPATLAGIDFDADPDAGVGTLCGFLALVMVVGIIGVIWAVIVHSNAQSVANDISTGSAFGWLLLSWIIVGIIIAVIQAVIGLAILGTTGI